MPAHYRLGQVDLRLTENASCVKLGGYALKRMHQDQDRGRDSRGTERTGQSQGGELKSGG